MEKQRCTSRQLSLPLHWEQPGSFQAHWRISIFAGFWELSETRAPVPHLCTVSNLQKQKFLLALLDKNLHCASWAAERNLTVPCTFMVERTALSVKPLSFNREKSCNSQLHLSVLCNIWLRANEEKLDNFLFSCLLCGQCPILQRSGHETFITKARVFTAALSKWCVLVPLTFNGLAIWVLEIKIPWPKLKRWVQLIKTLPKPYCSLCNSKNKTINCFINKVFSSSQLPANC